MPDNYSDNQLDLITSDQGTYENFTTEEGNYVQVIVSNQSGDVVTTNDGSLAIFSSFNDVDGVTIYTQTNGDMFVKPNEILSNNQISSGNYTLRFDFLRNWFINSGLSEDNNLSDNPRFYINQISPSRKEIRLLGRINENDNLVIDESVFDLVLKPDGTYLYNYVVRLDNGVLLPITNYVFDGDSIILRLQTPLPTNFNTLDIVSIEQILIDSQEQDIYYVSNVVGEGGTGGLTPYTEEYSHLLNAQGTDDLESYNELVLTSSISDEQLNLISGSVENQYQNLNIDFKHFSNHVFFGSAKSKLENFKTKVSTIENHLVEISQSLTVSQSSTGSNALENEFNDAISATHINDRRKVLFNKILDVKNNFTPYERFLYYDNQSNANTSSAPGLGNNLTDVIPVSQSSTYKQINNFDGFRTVHKISGSGDSVGLFTNKYFAKEAPFFNFSGSVYLSFLLKSSGSEAYGLTLNNTNVNQTPKLPADAFGGSAIQSPTSTGSAYQRYIFQASQSYFEPVIGTISPFTSDFTAGSDDFTILSGSNITGSGTFVEGGLYATFPQMFNPDIEETGSVLPMGELFNITYAPIGSAISSSYIVDARISLKNPTNALPFSQIYSTGSTEWTSWYDGLLTSASAYDDDNIHSLTNNLPRILREDDESTELKTFVNMWGEHFDLLRNYVDNYASFYKRKYKKSESIPTNLLPILAENLGWELINPFTGSLSEYFTSQTFGNNHQDVADNTWRKILNNLIYIYKSKGTSNAVQALLNTYGYPSDILTISEFGGSSEEHNPSIITNEIKTLRQGVGGASDNVSFIEEKAEFVAMNMRGTNKISTDWYMDNATPDTLEFVFATSDTTNNQTLVENSGSGGETMWDLRLLSNETLQFRLNTSLTGSLAIGSNNISITTPAITSSFERKDLFNVILQRDDLNTISAATQSYKLGLAFQDGDKIQEFNVVSTSVSNSIANDNFVGSGSRHALSSSNLFFGETLTGSMGEIRTWTGSLSMSKFKQHTLNKFSVIGNTGVSSSRELIYRFRLNENYPSGTLNDVLDANPNYNSDYTIPSSSLTITNGGDLYNSRIITVVKFGLRTGGENQRNDNKIVINPDRQMVEDLHPLRQSFKSNYDISDRNKRQSSNKLELVRSINKRINDYIINTLSDVNISDYFSDPRDLYEDNYDDLDNLRDDILEDVKVDVNKYIEAQSHLLNTAVIDGIAQIIPGHSNLSNIGVQIDQNLLERTKIQHREMTISTGSDAGLFDMDLGYLKDISYDFSNSSFDDEISFTDLKVNEEITLTDSEFELDKQALIDMDDDVIVLNKSEYVEFKDMNFDMVNSIYDLSKTEKINVLEDDIDIIDDVISFSEWNLQPIQDVTEIDLTTYVDESGEYSDTTDGNIDMVKQYSFSDSKFMDLYEFNINKPISFNSNVLVNESVYDLNLDYKTIYNLTSLYNDNVYDSTITYNDMHKLTSKYNENNYSLDLDYKTIYNLTSKYNENYYDYNLSYSDMHKLTSTYNENNFDYNLSYSDMHKLTFKYNENNFDYNLSYSDIHKLTSKYNENYYDYNLSYSDMYKLTSKYNENNFDLNLNQINIHDFSDSEFIQDREGVTDNKTIIGNNKDLSLTWGTTTNDTHFLNFQETLTPNRRNKGTNSDYNVDYYENRFNFITIGGSTLLSSSINVGGNGYIDFENHKFILNEKIHTDGRKIGATHKISSSADGVITYPENHFRNLGTSKLSIRNVFYVGSKNGITVQNENNNPIYSSQVQFPHGLDLQPTSSFYTIDVGGADTDTILRVEKPGGRTKT